MEPEKRIIEINGVKMEIDLRNAKTIDTYKVGDSIKVLVKGYSDSYTSHIGTIIGFDEFEQHPTICIAYLVIDYSEATVKFLYLNSTTKDIEIAPLNEYDKPLKRSDVITRFDKEIQKHKAEIEEIEKKQIVFEKLFGKYFEAETV